MIQFQCISKYIIYSYNLLYYSVISGNRIYTKTWKLVRLNRAKIGSFKLIAFKKYIMLLN